MDDPRLVRCTSCGNEILLDAGDSECYFCHEPLPKPCPLADSDRAEFANLAGVLGSMLVQGERIGEVDGDVAKIVCGILQKLAYLVGIDHAELSQAACSFAQSKDPERWLENMARF